MAPVDYCSQTETPTLIAGHGIVADVQRVLIGSISNRKPLGR